ncbi:MAG: hypothetical protein M1275_03975 [Patescibacteria group bacterium]|nr:hypothetical protein [Patescibacteria group bacterium]
MLPGNRVSVVIGGKVFAGDASIDMARETVHLSLDRRNCDHIDLDVPLTHTPAASPAAEAFNRLFHA